MNIPLWRPLRHLHQSKRHVSDARPFIAGDLVILRERKTRTASPIFTRPLKPGKRIDSHKGTIYHDDIIGKRPRHVVASRLSRNRSKTGDEEPKGTEYRIQEVKLEEYVRLSKRLVTPVYPADAALIVELLDLHPGVLHQQDCANASEETPKLEILEAGTGHGALTLYLARVIHAANAHLTPPPLQADGDDPRIAEEAETFKRNRLAILHTLDISAKYSQHAQNLIFAYRHGLYAPNIDFHVSPVSPWVREALTARHGKPFLSHAILDLPSADAQLADVAKAVRADGTIVVFNPSITQIMDCLNRVRDERIPLELETVLELPSNGGGKGREWDVRAVRPRTGRSTEVAADDGKAADPTQDARSESGSDEADVEVETDSEIVGGGFVGVFRKWREDQPE